MGQQPGNPNDRDAWRTLMYDSGYALSGAAATGPGTTYFEQSWRAIPTPPGEDAIGAFYTLGGQDRVAGWPNRGWQRNLISGYKYDPVTAAEGSRANSLRLWYTGGWFDAANGGYPDQATNKAAAKVSDPYYAPFLRGITTAEAVAEYNQGYLDQRAKAPPPLLGFLDPPPGLAGQPVVDPRSLPQKAAAAGSGAQPNLLQTFLPLAIISSLGKGKPAADQRPGTYNQGYRAGKANRTRKRGQSDEYNEGYDDGRQDRGTA